MSRENIDPLHEALVTALPPDVDFYHLGKLTLSLSETIQPSYLNSQAIAIQIQGDLRALLVFCFAPDQEESACFEMANILASKTVTELSHRENLDLIISPPSKLRPTQCEHMIRRSQPLTTRTYNYAYEGKEIPVTMFIMINSSSEVGSA
jgi:hypothetical protein